jgi:tetratricopeptide (TPR) repeat protein
MKKRCFVIQGFGKKQDYEQGKQFNLDASYAVIKDAIEEAEIECHRADELRTNALIDQVMYDELLDADLVVADITTLNFNAGFELGVRYALRPYATLVVGEQGMNFPFDVKHIYIHKYQHLGEDIGYGEAKRFSKELKELADQAVNNPRKDSPVYTYLNRLPEKGFLDIAKAVQTRMLSTDSSTSLRELINKAEAAMLAGRFDKAVEFWTRARDVAGKNDYVVQQLALATYKSKQPDAERALKKARTILEYLKPRESFDTETLGLWAAVHKGLYESSKNTGDLDDAIFALERGFFIKGDYYNGINLAFMFDAKAADSEAGAKEELRAIARHVRRRVKAICDQALVKQDLSESEKFWVLATLYEACVGLGQEDEAQDSKNDGDKISTAQWMIDTRDNQVAKLRKLLDK